MTIKLPRLHMVQFILIIHVQVIPLEVDLWIAVSRDSIKWVKIQIISLSALLVNTELVIYNITRQSLIPAWYIATNLDYICSQSGLTTICPAIFISPSAARFFLRCASPRQTRVVGPMLARRLRRRPNIKTPLGQRLMCAWVCLASLPLTVNT